MFRTVPLSIIRCFSLYTQQWCTSYNFADSKPALHIKLCISQTQQTFIMFIIVLEQYVSILIE